MRRFENILLWTLRLGLAAALFSPLIYSTNYFFPYIVPRAFYFQIITEILFAATVTLIAFFPQHRPRWNVLTVSLAIYLGIALLTTLTSADVAKSFIGTIERSFGSFQLLHFGMLFFAAIITLKNQRHWNAFFGLSLGVALYAALGLLIPVITTTSTTLPPTVAGNPIFLAAYLIFHLFFAAHLLQQTKKRWLKIPLYALIAIFAAAIFTSGVRGAFIGLSAAVGFLLIFNAWQWKRFRVALIGTLLILIAAYGLLFINRDQPFVKNNFVLSRITDFSLQDSTTKARFAMWKMALKGFQERPFFGWGRENYSLVFNAHYNPSFDDANVSEGWEDRTHNIFLEELTYGGIIGLLSYILLLTAAFFVLRNNLVLCALLIGYIVQNLFGVDNLNAYLPFFMFLAYSDFQLKRLHPQPPLQHSPQKSLSALGISAAGLFAVLFAFYFFTWKPAAAIRNFRSATIALAGNNIPEFKTQYQKGKDAASYFPYLRLEGASIIMSLMIQSGLVQQPNSIYPFYASLILPDIAELAKRNPAEQRWIFFLGKLYQNQAAVTRNIQWLDKSEAVWNELVASSPQRKNFREAYEHSSQFRAALMNFTSFGPRNPSQK